MRFRNRADRAAYVAAHALLRHMLSKALGGDPKAWAFEAGPLGKPALAAVHLRPWLHFNISHARGLVACVIAGVPVGVDVEASDGNVPSAVAERFAPGERAMLAKAAGAEYRSIFFRLWTLKEAYLKATGEGLSGRLDSPAFQLDPLRVTLWPSENGPAEPNNPDAWRFFECLPCDGYRLALAARRPNRTPLDLVAGVIDPADLG
ncbi:4'-phosphopantetheinyl transferase superfamily protein [Ciceribacter sp. RN22]|nr:4'-phosphopantetheinyl transferase superfamily protein [Ciceribacter sp. RN22]MCO6179733.1 4'-phosphopantetheinyl transferase superfamily protein [Ciceribacter sp. RN22]